jgi:DNA end-binding protein Ku
VHVEAAAEPEAPTDLMEALRASIEAAGRSRSGSGRGRRSGGRSSNGNLDAMSKDELYELAKKADIPGRSDMSKDELVEALRAA